jgi:hypothetical protein
VGVEEWGSETGNHMNKFKVSFFFLVFTFLGGFAFGQDSDLSSNYRLLLGINIQECDDNGSNPQTEIFARKGFVFTIEGKKDEDYIISFLIWDENVENTTLKDLNIRNNVTFYNNVSRSGNQSNKKFFLLKGEIFEDQEIVEKVMGNGFTFGSLTVPIKVRFGDNQNVSTSKRYTDFEGNINLGVAAGGRFGARNNGVVHNVLFGVNLTQVPLDAQNTKNFFGDKKINGSGVAFYASYLAEIKGFQFGAFLGRDYLGKEVGTQWIYNNKTWFGIGIGLNIFSNENNKVKQNNKD